MEGDNFHLAQVKHSQTPAVLWIPRLCPSPAQVLPSPAQCQERPKPLAMQMLEKSRKCLTREC